MRNRGLSGVWLAIALMVLFDRPAQAQARGPVVRIPIEKLREYYLNPAENGNGGCCGVKLYGEWPVYRNYTNRADYNVVLAGFNSSIYGYEIVQAPPGGRYENLILLLHIYDCHNWLLNQLTFLKHCHNDYKRDLQKRVRQSKHYQHHLFRKQYFHFLGFLNNLLLID